MLVSRIAGALCGQSTPCMLDSLSVFQLSFILFAFVVAYIIRGVTGFGSGLIAIPLMSLVLPVTVVVPFIGLIDFIAAAGHSFKYRKKVVWADLLPLLPFSFIGVGSALYIIHTVDADSLKTALALFILLYGSYALFSQPSKKLVSQLWCIPAGLFGGFIGALFGTGGPFYVMYFHARKIDKIAFRATIAMLFLIDGLGRVVGYFVTDVYQPDTAFWVLISLPIMIVAMIIGGKIHTKLSPDDFRKGINILLILSGIALLL